MAGSVVAACGAGAKPGGDPGTRSVEVEASSALASAASPSLGNGMVLVSTQDGVTAVNASP